MVGFAVAPIATTQGLFSIYSLCATLAPLATLALLSSLLNSPLLSLHAVYVCVCVCVSVWLCVRAWVRAWVRGCVCVCVWCVHVLGGIGQEARSECGGEASDRWTETENKRSCRASSSTLL